MTSRRRLWFALALALVLVATACTVERAGNPSASLPEAAEPAPSTTRTSVPGTPEEEVATAIELVTSGLLMRNPALVWESTSPAARQDCTPADLVDLMDLYFQDSAARVSVDVSGVDLSEELGYTRPENFTVRSTVELADGSVEVDQSTQEVGWPMVEVDGQWYLDHNPCELTEFQFLSEVAETGTAYWDALIRGDFEAATNVLDDAGVDVKPTLVVLPIPSRPEALLPQHFTSPDVRMTQV